MATVEQIPNGEEPTRHSEHLAQYELGRWTPDDVPEILALENAAWPKWLRKSEKGIKTIAERYPDLQLLVRKPDGGPIVATMTTNRIQWNGDPTALTTWDEIAGGSVDTSDNVSAYVSDGNTICIVSSSANPLLQRQGLGRRLIRGVTALAQKVGAKHLIGPFRPSGYGAYKLDHGPTDFERYTQMAGSDGRVLDPWLRTAIAMGMKPLKVALDSMVVEVPLSDWKKDYFDPATWQKQIDGRWECGETGSWRLHKNRRGEDVATYTEPNLWGSFPIPTAGTAPAPPAFRSVRTR